MSFFRSKKDPDAIDDGGDSHHHHLAGVSDPSLSYSQNTKGHVSSGDQSAGLSYSSAGGGEAAFEPTPSTFFGSLFRFLHEEAQRPSRDPVTVRGPDLHQRLPVWMETKDVDIQGNPLSEKELEDASRWRGKYKRELDIADAVVRVKTQRIKELDHDVWGSYRQVRRWLGYEPPLSEKDAQRAAEERWRERMRVEEEGGGGTAARIGSSAGASATTTTTAEEGSAVQSGTLYDGPRHPSHHFRSVQTAWKVLMTTAETGRPLAQVAAEYRPRVDFYGLDAFLDSPASFVWFWTKMGMFMGLVQGTARAAQAITSDVQYLRASGVGVLSVLNLSVLAGVVKWGGNCALLGTAFCLGDGLVTATRSLCFPAHENNVARRTTSNYVGGLACAGATVGVMPWWILNDTALAMRLSVTGVCVGGALGLVVGLLLQRMVSMNLSRLEASPRHLRRYEALLLRQREWVEEEVKACQKSAVVWW